MAIRGRLKWPRHRDRVLAPDHIDGRSIENAGGPGNVNTWSAATNLASLVAASGLSEEEIKQRLKEQNYSERIIQRLTNGELLPRIVSSRISACLGLRHDQARGE